MARAHVEYRAQQGLDLALRMSAAGEHAWAIDAAKDAVELLTPDADRHPAALARALAVRAACLHVRGRTEDAARDAAACDRRFAEALSRGSAGADQFDDLADAAVNLAVAGRDERAAALIDQCLERRRAAVRRTLSRAVAAVGTVARLHPADYLPDAVNIGRVAAKARAARAEAEIRRLAGTDDPRRLTRAWGALANARWQSGGRRSDALQAQRTALAAARRWAEADPSSGTADLAVTIGLQTDAEAARAEAATLDQRERG
nr:hypothetical protein GCM10020063_046220 [Dactylosporangium thailandense]